MIRCFVTPEALHAETVTSDRALAHHLQRVLRVRPGMAVQLFDGAGATREAVVEAVTRHAVTLQAAGAVVLHSRPACALTLFACVSKGKRMDWSVEKAVELSVARVVPVLSARSVIRLTPAEAMEKTERWQRVSEEAARQCGACWLPEILSPCSFDAALALLPKAHPLFVAALTPGARPLRTALAAFSEPPRQAGWFVGPEGDFTETELAALMQNGAIPVRLGPLVLRAETACLYGLCVLQCAWI